MKACDGIGEFGGERITADRKEYIVRQINAYCQKPAMIVYIFFWLGWLMLAVLSIGIVEAFFSCNNILMTLFFAICLLISAFAVVYFWIPGNIMRYDSIKKDIKIIEKHELYEIQVSLVNKLVGTGYYKQKYMVFSIGNVVFEDIYEIPDEVFENIEQYSFSACYCEFTGKERKLDRYLPQYGIYIICEEVESK